MRSSYQQLRHENLHLTVVIVGLSLLLLCLWFKERQLRQQVEDIDGVLFSHVLPIAGLPHPATHTPATTMDVSQSAIINMESIHDYGRFLDPLRTKQGMKLLELGHKFGYSNQMWQQYFPHGEVLVIDTRYGVAINDLQKFLESKGLQSNLDCIIDDGGHHSGPRISSLVYLFEHGLKPGGVYIIKYVNQDHVYVAINRLKELIDVVNRQCQPDSEVFRSSFGKAVDDSVQSIFFGPNAVVILKMNTNESAEYQPDTFLWKDRLKVPD